MSNPILLNAVSHHGTGAVNQVAIEAKRLGCTKALVITDPDLLKFGVTAKVLSILDDAGIPYETFSDIKPNPTVQNIWDGAKALKASGADMIIAVGGGSAMDSSKAIGVVVANPQIENLHELEGAVTTPNPCMPIIAVATTAGTGSEVGNAYVITDVDECRKFVCLDPNCLPVVAIVDPEMMASMPVGLTASTGMDALTHAIESYTTKAAWEMSDMFSLKAIELVSKHLRESVEEARTGASGPGREGMALAEYLASMSFSNVGLGIAHSMAHALGATYDTPHGVACAMTLPIVLKYNAEYTGEQYREIARAMGVAGVDDMSAEEYRAAAIDAVVQLGKDVGIPEKLDSIREEGLDFLARSAEADANTPKNPRPAGAAELKELFAQLM